MNGINVSKKSHYEKRFFVYKIQEKYGRVYLSPVLYFLSVGASALEHLAARERATRCRIRD